MLIFSEINIYLSNMVSVPYDLRGLGNIWLEISFPADLLRRTKTALSLFYTSCKFTLGLCPYLHPDADFALGISHETRDQS